MGRLVFWCVTAIALAVAFLGVRQAGGLTQTIMGTGGSVVGLVIGGVPTFVGAFQNGVGAGGGGAKGGGAGAGATWQGGITQFGVPQAPSAPVEEKPRKRPGQAPV